MTETTHPNPFIKQYLAYMDQVFEKLVWLDYPELVLGFDIIDVAMSLEGAIHTFFTMGISPRMAAICIWALTMNEQVIPQADQMTKQ